MTTTKKSRCVPFVERLTSILSQNFLLLFLFLFFLLEQNKRVKEKHKFVQLLKKKKNNIEGIKKNLSNNFFNYHFYLNSFFVFVLFGSKTKFNKTSSK